MCITEALLISEQITEWRFGSLWEISNKFSSKLGVLAIWFNSAGLTFWKVFITILYDSEKCSGLVVLLGHSLYPKVYLFKGENDEAFYNGKKKCKDKNFDLAYVGRNC